MPDSFVRRVATGARAVVAGAGRVSKDPEVRKTYRWLLLALFLLAMAFNAAGILTVFHFTTVEADAGGFWKWGMFVLRIVGGALVFFLSPAVAITACNLLFPVFSEIPFFAGMASLDPSRASALRTREGLNLRTAILHSVRRFATLLLVSLVCFLLALVPVVGTFCAPALQLYLVARIVGWEMLDPYFDRLQLSWGQQKDIVQKHQAEILGIGLVCAPVFAVPIVGPLFFGLLQASVAQFVIAIFPSDDIFCSAPSLSPKVPS